MKKLVFLILFFAKTLGLSAQVIHVRPTVSGNGSGDDWANAATLQHAISVATPASVLWVQAGTYMLSETLNVPQGVRLYGGFFGNETEIGQRNFATHRTILDANFSFAVVTLQNNAVINGFTIQNGVANHPERMNGGGVLMSDGARIEHSHITNNVSANYGGGVFVKPGAIVEISNSVIANNRAVNDGFAVYGDRVDFRNNSVAYNSALDCSEFPNSVFSQTICAGEGLVLTTEIEGTRYTWNTGEITRTITTPDLFEDTTFTVSIATLNFCVVEHSFEITVNPIPTLSILTEPARANPGETGRFTAIAFPSGGSFLWDDILETTDTFLLAEMPNEGDLQFTVTYELDGCWAIPATATIENTQCFPADISNAIFVADYDEICRGDSLFLRLTGAIRNTGEWVLFAGSCGGSEPIARSHYNNPTFWVGPTETTTFFLRGEGCDLPPTACLSVEIIVNALPEDIVPTKTSLCPGEHIILTNPTIGGGFWEIESVGNITIASSDAYTATITGLTSGLSVVSFTTPEGCQTFIALTVLQTPSAIVGQTNLCQGAERVFTATPIGGTWSIANETFATIDATGRVTASTANYGATTISYSHPATGCHISQQITIHPQPTQPSASAHAICIGETATLNAGGAGGTWSITPASVAQFNVDFTEITGLLAGNAIVRYQLNAYCSDTFHITVKPLPLSLSHALAICEGDTLLATGNPAGGTWSINETYATVHPTTGNFAGVSEGVFSLIYTLPNTCFLISREITVNPTPEITGNTSVGVGHSTQLSSAIGGTWLSLNPTVATVNINGLVTGVSPGIATIRYTFAVGNCYSEFEILVGHCATLTLQTAPETTHQHICFGEPIQEIRYVLAHAETAEIVWTPNAPTGIVFDAETLTISGAPTESGTFNFSIHSIGYFSACSPAVATGTLTVFAPISAGNITSSSGTAFSICSQEIPAEFTSASLASGGNPVGFSYQWQISEDNVEFTDIDGATSPYFHSPALTETRHFRRLYLNACGVGFFPSSVISVTVNVRPEISETSGYSRCGTGSVAISATSVGNEIRWLDVVNETLLHTTNSSEDWVQNLSATTSFYAEAITSHGCVSLTRTLVTATIFDVPATPIGVGASRCGTGDITISASSADNQIRWYNDAETLVNTTYSGVMWTQHLSATTTFYAQAFTLDGCSSETRTPVVATIHDVPDPITGNHAVGDGLSTPLVSSPGGVWTSSNPAIATIDQTGMVTGVTDGTVTIRNTFEPSGCYVSFTITVGLCASLTLVPGLETNQNVCVDLPIQTIVYEVVNATQITVEWTPHQPAGLTYNFYLATLTISGTPTEIGSFEYTIATIDHADGCPPATATGTITVHGRPTAPGGTSESRCGAGHVEISAISVGNQIRWYNATGNLLETVSSGTWTTPSISATTTFYAESFTADGCFSVARTPVVATIFTIPTAPTVVAGNHCGAGTVALSAISAGNQIRWYNATGNLLETVNSGAWTTPSLSATTTFYAESFTANGCISVSRTPVVATIFDVPSAPTVIADNRCGAGTVTLSAISAGNQIHWYNAVGNLVTTVNSGTWTTPSLSTTTTFYAESFTADGCTSVARTPVVATIFNIPSAPSVTPYSRCGAGTVTLSAISEGNQIRWYNVAGDLLETVNSGAWTTESLSTTTTFYAESFTADGCISVSRTPVIATAAPEHVLTVTGNTSQSLCPGATLATINFGLTGGATDATLVWTGATATAPLGVSPSISSVFGTISPQAIAGTYTWTLTTLPAGGVCPQISRTGTITVNPLPAPVTVTATPDCGHTTLIASSETRMGDTIFWQNTATGGTSIASPSTSQHVTTPGTYFFRARSEHGCWGLQGGASVTTIIQPHTLSLTSAPETTDQVLHLGATMEPITYLRGGGATSARITWTGTLNPNIPPSGITVSPLDATTLTISGMPRVEGTFTYTITTEPSGGICPTVQQTGTITTIIPMTSCNDNVLAFDLGAHSFRTDQTWQVGNEDVWQEWSDAVRMEGCAKTTFNSGTDGDLNADCRSASPPATGNLFSWCMVVRFADVLCPYPWRVPTTFDFVDLDLIMGGTGQNRGGTANDFTIAQQVAWYLPADGTGTSPQFGGIWGGSRFTGHSSNLETAGTLYWSSTEINEAQAFAFRISSSVVNPQNTDPKILGITLRCVRNIPPPHSARNCNNNPLPFAIGTQSFASAQTWRVGTGDNEQEWSDAVRMSGCVGRGAFTIAPGANINADCMQHPTLANRNISGHLFSWCFVTRFAEEICPHPWRVPTTEDFVRLHTNLGYTMPATVGGTSPLIANTYLGVSGSAASPQRGGLWGGLRWTARSDATGGANSHYWSLSDVSITNARALSLTASLATPQASVPKIFGLVVRCVREVTE